MKAIIAINSLGYIGLSDGLPWRCKEDLAHFKALTMGATLLVGHKTAATLPPLKGRTVVVDNREDEIDLSTIDWCIGGKKTYDKYCHLFNELHISYIDDNTVGDTKQPELANLNPECKILNYFFVADAL